MQGEGRVLELGAGVWALCAGRMKFKAIPPCPRRVAVILVAPFWVMGEFGKGILRAGGVPVLTSAWLCSQG